MPDRREPCGILALLRQSIQQELGQAREQPLTLYLYLVTAQGVTTALEPDERAAVIRTCTAAARLREPIEHELIQRMAALQNSIGTDLRRPNSSDSDQRIRQPCRRSSLLYLSSRTSLATTRVFSRRHIEPRG